jgi:Predicted aminoglycoside phosphotransferase
MTFQPDQNEIDFVNKSLEAYNDGIVVDHVPEGCQKYHLIKKLEDEKNVPLTDLKLVGQGATADVFLYSEEKVVKLFKSGYSKDAVEYEARIAGVIQNVYPSAPGMYGTVRSGDRWGIVYEYIPGYSLFDELAGNRKNIKTIVEELVDTQLDITRIECAGLPSQKDRFCEQIRRTGLDDGTKAVLYGYVSALPAKTNVCHGDFHVGNIIRSDGRLVVLDWMNCYTGNAETDLVRSILMMESPYVPLDLTFVQRTLFLLLKRKIAALYKKTVLSKYAVQNYNVWLTLAAAVRLSDNVPGEERWLTRMIKRNIRYVK